jgi:ABC-type nitrate/sulfonate/bicarbonate transport system substrate-binding protein
MSSSPVPSSRMPWSRRDLLRAGGFAAAAGLSASFLASCSSGGDAGGSASAGSKGRQKMTFQLSWLPTTEFAGTWIALNKGYYSTEGIDLSWLPGGPNASPETVVSSGKATVGMLNSDAVAKAQNEGAPIKIIAALCQKSPFCILSKASTPISTPQDMIGKKIGVAATDQTAFDLLLTLNNIKKSQVTVVPVQFDPAPVANGEVAGQIVYYTNEPQSLEVRGIKTHTFLLADFGYTVLSDVFFATEQTIAEKPDLLASFLRATRKGWTDNIADPQLGTDLAVGTYGKSQGLDAKQQILESKAMTDLIVTPAAPKAIALPDALMTATVATLKKAGINTSVDKLFNTQILAKVGV